MNRRRMRRGIRALSPAYLVATLAAPLAFAAGPHASLDWVIAQARKPSNAGSIEAVSGRLEAWARQKNVLFERVRLAKQGPAWIASTRNTQGESRTFRLQTEPRLTHGRPDNVIAGVPDAELLAHVLPALPPGRLSPIRELAADAVTGAPRRALCLRLVSRRPTAYEFEVLTATD